MARDKPVCGLDTDVDFVPLVEDLDHEGDRVESDAVEEEKVGIGAKGMLGEGRLMLEAGWMAVEGGEKSPGGRDRGRGDGIGRGSASARPSDYGTND
jgi:hypothetical protein